MTKLGQFLRGYAVLELVSAAPELCLNRLSNANIPFQDASVLAGITIRIMVPYSIAEKVCAMSEVLQAEITVVKQIRGFRYPLLWLKRPFLILGFLAAMFATLVLPDYVWTISVTGNETIPTAQILQALDEIGVHFGIKNETIDSQQIKNQLLNAVDGLQWAAVNCSGGHCQVLVKERETAPALLDRSLITDVIASSAGVITEMRVLAGQPLFQVGDTVQAGDTLVSGISDWGIVLQKSRAEAEIYALTWHSTRSTTPEKYSLKENTAETFVCRYLQLGRFRIKISGNSRICIPGCAKIITRENMTLPGGYVLPVCRITETATLFTLREQKLSSRDAANLLQAFGASQTEAGMVAGRILSKDLDLSAAKGMFTMNATYSCREMIAREQNVNVFGSEQIYGRTNSERGTD